MPMNCDDGLAIAAVTAMKFAMGSSLANSFSQITSAFIGWTKETVSAKANANPMIAGKRRLMVITIYWDMRIKLLERNRQKIRAGILLNLDWVGFHIPAMRFMQVVKIFWIGREMLPIHPIFYCLLLARETSTLGAIRGVSDGAQSSVDQFSI